MYPVIEDEYYAVGGNRHSAAADWSVASGLLAFGADQNVAIWSPLDDSGRGISTVLPGHTSRTTAVKFASHTGHSADEVLITGAANGEVLLWKNDQS